MIKIKCGDVVRAVGGKLICGEEDMSVLNVCIDSRKIAEGDLFIPIKGERFDGHDYIEASFKAGAAAAFTHKDMLPAEGKALIRVADTQKALKDLAAWYRSLFKIPVVGITGSVGKTSTKDMVAVVLEQKFKVLKTQGNFNNEIGLPLTIFNIEPSHQAAVLEMGMSNFGEIRSLTGISRPSTAIITNIGMSHIENLGSRENILKAKLEILEGLSRDGLVILNGDDPLLAPVGKKLEFRKVSYAIEREADYRAYDIISKGENGTYFKVKIREIEYNVYIPVPGRHNVYNALAAIATGIEQEIPVERIIEGISNFSPGKMRLNIISHKGIRIINDAYNASPNSMEAAINVLKDVAGEKRTVAVLGDMLEMGAWAPEAHKEVGRYALSKGVDCILTVGTNGRFIAQGAVEKGAAEGSVYSFDSNSELNGFICDFLKEEDVLLVKGSRGMKMEEIVEYIIEFYS